LVSWDYMFEKGIYGLKSPDRLVIEKEKSFKERKIKRILDVGCGEGRHILFLSKKGYILHGLDISEKALYSSRMILNRENISNNLLLGDMANLPYKDDSFDMILGWRVIHLNTKDGISKTIFEIERVIRPYGIFYGSVRSKRNTLFYIANEHGKEIEEGTFMMKNKNMDGLIYHFFDENEIKKAFSKFNIIELYETELEHTSYTKGYINLKNYFWIILCENTKRD